MSAELKLSKTLHKIRIQFTAFGQYPCDNKYRVKTVKLHAPVDDWDRILDGPPFIKLMESALIANDQDLASSNFKITHYEYVQYVKDIIDARK